MNKIQKYQFNIYKYIFDAYMLNKINNYTDGINICYHSKDKKQIKKHALYLDLLES